ncbi:MAG: ABC transporter substrate-binding protein [Lachnospiraceae bacterium]|nr:ABC transporter substrate-binding protein [Lachnospiraceae bacterium]
MKRKLVSILTAAVMALSMAACGGSAASTQNTSSSAAVGGSAQTTAAAGSKDLVIGCAVDIVTLDPGRAYELYAGTVINACYDTLFRFEQGSSEPVNDLASSYEFSEDGLTCTISLVQNAKFASGNPVTSKDVAFSLMRLKNLQDNPAFIMDSVDSIETPDDYTAVFHLNQKDASLIAKLTYISTSILDSTALADKGATDGADAATADTATSAMDEASYGSGPYIMTKYSADEEIDLARNENYWGDTVPAADSYVIQVMDDANTQLMSLTQGDIDIAVNLNNDTIDQLDGNDAVTVNNQSTMCMVFLYMNMNSEHGPISDPKVQEAIRLAVDFDGLRSMAGEGATTPLSFIQSGFDSCIGERTTARDVEKAKELLKEAGYGDGLSIDFPCCTLSAEGIPLTDIAQKLASDLAEIGITLNISTVDWAGGYADDYRNGKIGFSVMYWSPDYQDPVSQLAFMPGESVGLRAGWTADMNPELVALTESAKTETDVTARNELLKTLQEDTSETGPFLTLFQCPKHLGYRSDLDHVNFSDSYRIDLREITIG